MTIDVSPLFEPLEVRGKTFRNRIVMPPMVQLRGITTPDGIAWYKEHARGGVGLVIVETTGVHRFGTELTAENLKPLVDAIHGEGALAAIQLFPWIFGETVAPADLSRAEIEDLIGAFGIAARVCSEAGFDGVEPHGAHGYLLNQFFSPVANERTDEFGGDLENRMRLALAITRTVKDEIGPDVLLLYRHTPVGKVYGIEESLFLAERLAEIGVDVLDVSPASSDAPGDRAAPFKQLGIPVIAVNELDVVERALEVLHENRADLIAIGRGLIADPDWPIKVRTDRLDEIVHCIRCGKKCFGNLSARIPIECSQWESTP
jgi:2,4-dienoyl-CoA reductase-like NADH-dependent reductase (Old Yellow Enzyme family)